jgi:hypothetical protein
VKKGVEEVVEVVEVVEEEAADHFGFLVNSNTVQSVWIGFLT